MKSCIYCTPEWLDTCRQAYLENPENQKNMEKIAAKVCFRVKAEPEWGIDRDILFSAFVDKGALDRLNFISEEEAKQAAEYILTATPQEWKKILRKESKFVTDFMLGKIVLEQGSKVGVLSLAPHSNALIDALTPTPLQFPDEMTPEEFEQFRSHLDTFRASSKV